MFFREKIGRNGQVLQLVESYRNAEGCPRQRVVASPGNAALPDAERKAIAMADELHLRREDRLETAGDTRDWRPLRRLLSTHVVLTTRLPLADGGEISIRKPSEPDAEQQRIYTQLDIDWKRAFPSHKTEVNP